MTLDVLWSSRPHVHPLLSMLDDTYPKRPRRPLNRGGARGRLRRRAGLCGTTSTVVPTASAVVSRFSSAGHCGASGHRHCRGQRVRTTRAVVVDADEWDLVVTGSAAHPSRRFSATAPPRRGTTLPNIRALLLRVLPLGSALPARRCEGRQERWSAFAVRRNAGSEHVIRSVEQEHCRDCWGDWICARWAKGA